MSHPGRGTRVTVIVAGVVMLAIAAGTAVAVIAEERPGGLLMIALLFGFIGCAVIMPQWRETGIRFTSSLVSGETGPRERRRPPEDTEVERPVGEELDDEEELTQLEASFDNVEHDIIHELVGAQDPDTVWRLVRRAMEQNEFGRARAICDAALDEYGDHPKFLITSGYLARQAGDVAKAIREQEKAIDASDVEGEFREQYYVASSNLAYYLALQRHNRDRALEVGRRAAKVADEFDDRDSFAINHAYARLRFARDSDELTDAVKHLAALHDRDLSAAEIREVNRYIREGLDQMEEAAAG